jgi:hypothetical protein
VQTAGVAWYDEPDELDVEWLTYDIAKDFSPDQGRDDHGRWSTGGGTGGGSYSSWTRAFDSRAHDKQIEAHRATEEKHRAEGTKIKDRISALKTRAKDATPAQRARLKTQSDSLKQKYDAHRTAATQARDARRGVQSDLDRARSEHASAMHAPSAARTEHAADIAAHQDAGGIAIGQSRIGESWSTAHDVEPTAQVQHYEHSPEHGMRIGSDTIRGEPEAPDKPKEDLTSYRAPRSASDRQVVSYATAVPKTQAEWNEHDQKQREDREASDRRARERNDAAKPTPAPKQEPLPEARARTGLWGRMRSAFTRKADGIEVVEVTPEEFMSGDWLAKGGEGEFDESKHPRDHGKFSASEGESGEHHPGHEDDDAKHNRAVDEAAAKGHITTEARDLAQAYVAGHGERDRIVDEHTAALDHAHRDATEALHALHEYEHEGNDDVKPAELQHTHELAEGFSETQRELDGAHEGYDREVIQRGLPEVLHPDEMDSSHEGFVPHPDDLPEHERPTSPDEDARMVAEHEAFYDRQVAAHEANKPNIDAHNAEFKARAEAAQSALERLHERQAVSHDALQAAHKEGESAERDATKTLDKMNDEHHVQEGAFAHHERDESGEIADDTARGDREDAGQLSETMRDRAQSAIADRPAHDLGDAVKSIRDDHKDTARAIKELSKITGRAARYTEIASRVKPAKKSIDPVAKLYWLHAAVDLLRAVGVELPW